MWQRFTSSEWAMIASAGILAVGLATTGAIAGSAFYQVHALSNTLAVTGSATATTTADTATWRISVNRLATEGALGSAQAAVSRDAQSVINFVSRGGIDSAQIQVSTVYVDREYSNDNALRYNVHEDIDVSSSDVHLIERLSKDVSSLIAQGIVLSSQAPQYYVNDLPQLRVSLIGKAITDAKARAQEIAKSTGQSVGALQSASGGVVQVMSPNSTDVSDYGSYDTSTIDKQIMVTAHATFLIR